MTSCSSIVFDPVRNTWVCESHGLTIIIALLGIIAVLLALNLLARFKMSVALDALNSNIQTLNGTIQKAITALGNTGVPEADVQAAADAVAAANQTLNAAIPGGGQ